MGETPHISARTAWLPRHIYPTTILSSCIYLLYRLVDQPPKGGGIVTQQYVLVRPVPVQYVLSTYLYYRYYWYRLYYWSTCHSFLRGLAVQQLLATHPPGFSSSHIFDIYVIQCCTSTRHSTSHIHHTYLYKLIKSQSFHSITSSNATILILASDYQ